jgi:iron complex outermembrane receptor protein
MAAETAAPASGASDQVSDVIVTAQRRDEKLQTVPVTVEAFPASVLAVKGVTTVADLGTVTPGLEFSSIVGYAIPYLRGVGTTSTGPGFENPIAMYVDGVYYAAQGGALLSLNNIEAIEVDKGPQGTLFGRNATGGAIQIRTKTPSDVFGGMISGGYGNYNTTHGDLYVTGGLVKNLAADLAIDYSDQGQGYGRNLTLGKDIDKNNDFSARSKLFYTPTDRTEVTVIGDYSITRGVPALLPAPGTTPLGSRPPATNPRDGYGLTQPFSVVAQWGLSATVKQDLNFAQLVSITAYRDTKYHARFDNMLTDDPKANFFVDTTEPHKQVTQEFQLLSKTPGPLSWVAGAYGFWEQASYNQPTLIGGGSLHLPLPIVQSPDTQGLSGAGFGQATYEITPTTKLTGGLRYTIERRELDSHQVIDLITTKLMFSSNISKTYDKLTWRFALSQDFTKDVMGYVSYNRGFKSGGFNTSTYPPVEFQPESIDSYEAGVKSEWLDRRLRLNLAGFFYDYSNIQTTSYPNGSLIVTNGGSAHIYGADLDAEYVVTPEFHLSGGLEALDAKFQQFNQAPISSVKAGGGTSFVVGSAAGKYLPKAPKLTFNVSGDYSKTVSFGKLIADITYSYNDGFFGDPDNRLSQPAYSLVNGTIGVEALPNGWSVKLWGKNLLDSRYAVTLAAQSQGDYIQYADPRTYGVTVAKKF